MSGAKLQIGASRDRVDEAKSTGWSLVTDVRVDADLRESERRREEEELSRVRLKCFVFRVGCSMCAFSNFYCRARVSSSVFAQARLVRVEHEVAESSVRNAKIDAAWAVLQKAVVAQDLHLDIQMQQKCGRG